MASVLQISMTPSFKYGRPLNLDGPPLELAPSLEEPLTLAPLYMSFPPSNLDAPSILWSFFSLKCSTPTFGKGFNLDATLGEGLSHL